MRKSALLILSAKYCNPELQVEFGSRIPACMVPVGSKLLLDLQIEQFKDWNLQRIVVAVPGGYSTHHTNPMVEFLPVETESMDETYRALTEHLRSSLGRSEGSIFVDEGWDIHVLNGDTLVSFVPEEWESNSVYMVKEDTPFSWSRDKPESPVVFSGYLTFRVDAQTPIGIDFSSHSELVTRLTRVSSGTWFDFGHMHTYYRSKRQWMTTRHFNSLRIENGCIVKSGEAKKVAAEYDWYLEVPTELYVYLPQLGGYKDGSYTMEYLPMPSLAELLVYGDHGEQYWRNMMHKILSMVKVFKKCAALEFSPEAAGDGLFLQKSKDRVKTLVYPIRKRAESMIEALMEYPHPAHHVIHGDLCFSNILYDMRSDRLKVIDPRGLDSKGKNSIYGNTLYDLAKLYHSVNGYYDFKVPNRSPSARQAQAAQVMSGMIEEFVTSWLGESGVKRLTLATGVLFYSMLPLHNDNEFKVDRLLTVADNYYRICEENKWIG